MTILREINDIDTLVRWRGEVIENVFGVKPDAELLEANREYYLRHIAEGTHLAVVAQEEGNEKGCGSICFSEELPSPDNPSGLCAYLMNIYVREPFRSHGTGHKIVEYLVSKALERGCGKIYLETTPEGRPVYESLGFSDMKDMMKLTAPLSFSH